MPIRNNIIVIPENFLFAQRKKIYPGPSYALGQIGLAENATGFRINFLSSRYAGRRESFPE